MKASNPLIRFAYGKCPPPATSICTLFWRCVVNILFCVSVFICLLAAIWSIYDDWLGYLWALGMVIAACVAFFIIGKWVCEWKGPEIVAALLRFSDYVSDGTMTLNNSLLMQGLYAIKHRLCPIVKIER